jgi:hypothetical protein
VIAEAEHARATVERGHEEVATLLSRIASGDFAVPGVGGAAWSPKDLLAHLALWQEIAVRTVAEFRSGEEPWIAGVFAGPGPGPNDEELAARSTWAFEQARAAYAGSHQEVLRLLEELSEAEWMSPVRGWHEEPPSLGGLLGVVLGKDDMPFGHALAHTPDLQAFVESRSGS